MTDEARFIHGSPREGDRVQVEELGTVIELQSRSGVDGAVVELYEDGNHVWVPLRALMVV